MSAMRRPGIAALILLAVLLPAGSSTARAADEVRVERLGGATRIETAVEISKATYGDRNSSAFLAGATAFPDALAASYPAAIYSSPILLTPKERLHEATREELLRLQVDRVDILGDTTVVSNAVQDELASLGIESNRLAGETRYETSLQANAVGGGENVGGPALVATGTGFADALAVGPLAAGLYWPIVLTTPDELHPAARESFGYGYNEAILVGGTAAIADRVGEQIEQICRSAQDPDRPDAQNCVKVIGRIGGADRTQTAALFADELVRQVGTPPTHVNLARGDDFADAAAGGPHAGDELAPILLTVNRDELGEATRQWLEEHADTIESIHVFGTRGAISDEVVEEAREAATAD